MLDDSNFAVLLPGTTVDGAGFVSGVGDQQPFNALTGQIGVQTGDTAGAALLGTDAAGTGGFRDVGRWGSAVCRICV